MEARAICLNYASSLSYTFSLGMLNILIPLYAIHLGFSAVQVGLVVSAVAITQIPLGLFGSAVTDRIGEKFILIVSFCLITLAAITFSFVREAFWGLVIGQVISGMSRAVFWSASQSYASRINEKRSSQILSYLSSMTNVGQILGLVIAGFIVSILGYKAAFLTCSLLGGISFLLALLLPKLVHQKQKVTFSLKGFLQPIARGLTLRVNYLAGISAYVAGLAVASMNSIYAIHFTYIGYGESIIGLFAALRPVGGVIVGFVFVSILSRIGQKWLYALGIGGSGLMLLISPFFTNYWFISTVIVGLGITSGFSYILYQTIATEYSQSENRALSLAIPGLFFALAHLTVPSLNGFLITLLGIKQAFWVGGGILLSASFFTWSFFSLLLKGEQRSIHRDSDS